MDKNSARAIIKGVLYQIGSLRSIQTGHGESCKALVFEDYAGDGGNIEKLIDYCESLFFAKKN